jgi:DNA repair protein SbcD/Mre11
MSSWPFRFVHAADLHLELPPGGVAEVPDHLRELFIESPYWAAERVFETVRSEEADFLVLAGDVLDPRRTGPRGPLFLAEQFHKLAERGVKVYWAGGRVDPPDIWPSNVPLPDNVHLFPVGQPEEVIHDRDGAPLARLMGASRGQSRSIRPGRFETVPDGLFSIAVAHGTANPESLIDRGINYWALGGRHMRHTLIGSPHVAHYPGSPQGRGPEQSGPFGCTMVQVDANGRQRSTAVPAALMRWQSERIVVEESHGRDDLEAILRQRITQVQQASGETDVLVSWTIAGSGPLLGQLRRGRLSGELLEALRAEYGHGPPAVWSVSLEAEPAAVLPLEWYEQQTIRGEFLRAVRHYQMNPDEPIDLESYLAEEHLSGTLGDMVAVSSPATRDSVLLEAAMLGVDLLSPEESES